MFVVLRIESNLCRDVLKMQSAAVLVERQSMESRREHVQLPIAIVVSHGTTGPVSLVLVNPAPLRHVAELATQIVKQDRVGLCHNQHVLPPIIVSIKGGTSTTERLERAHGPWLFWKRIRQASLFRCIHER